MASSTSKSRTASLRSPPISPTRYVELLFGVNARLALTEASQRRLFFERELSAAKENLAKAETALKQTQETTGILQLDSQARALVQAVAGVKAEIAAKEVQLRAMNTLRRRRMPRS